MCGGAADPLAMHRGAWTALMAAAGMAGRPAAAAAAGSRGGSRVATGDGDGDGNGGAGGGRGAGGGGAAGRLRDGELERIFLAANWEEDRQSPEGQSNPDTALTRPEWLEALVRTAAAAEEAGALQPAGAAAAAAAASGGDATASGGQPKAEPTMHSLAAPPPAAAAAADPNADPSRPRPPQLDVDLEPSVPVLDLDEIERDAAAAHAAAAAPQEAAAPKAAALAPSPTAAAAAGGRNGSPTAPTAVVPPSPTAPARRSASAASAASANTKAAAAAAAGRPSGLAASLVRLLDEHLFPNVPPAALVDPAELRDTRLRTPEVAAVMAEHSGLLQALFSHYAGLARVRGGGGSGGGDRRLLQLPEWLELCGEGGLLGAGFTQREARLAFAHSRARLHN
ncbi:hypothetical protein GPECTOR_12g349 [Gonium pectorale]|uniref:Uncharacterized protein n=1 Tax=Gonium pectorale TaxID=33097 RepID=A0A150GNJ2_GONPE|nr:hypothetical protein GPECTOR_12g349 [Gonium pectorale]|eukprot:KXZ51387.1 hypothetical protein GPECTOR_12g349 [Gonium pectorale]